MPLRNVLAIKLGGNGYICCHSELFCGWISGSRHPPLSSFPPRQHLSQLNTGPNRGRKEGKLYINSKGGWHQPGNGWNHILTQLVNNCAAVSLVMAFEKCFRGWKVSNSWPRRQRCEPKQFDFPSHGKLDNVWNLLKLFHKNLLKLFQKNLLNSFIKIS